MEGSLVRVSTKSRQPGSDPSGLPKFAQDGPVEVHTYGVGDDYNHYRTTGKGGTLDRAVMFYTTDKIEELRSEGWPLAAGDIGENLTIDGIPYDSFSVGDRVRVGEVEIEISERVNPCYKLANLDYVGKEHEKEFIRTMKGRRGWYARVLKEGTVQTGDPVENLGKSKGLKQDRLRI